jgi:hypothetical protein
LGKKIHGKFSEIIFIEIIFGEIIFGDFFTKKIYENAERSVA